MPWCCYDNKDNTKINLKENVQYELTIALKKPILFSPLIVGQSYKAFMLNPYINNSRSIIIIYPTENGKYGQYIDLFNSREKYFYKRYIILNIEKMSEKITDARYHKYFQL